MSGEPSQSSCLTSCRTPRSQQPFTAKLIAVQNQKGIHKEKNPVFRNEAYPVSLQVDLV
ncbi:MAG: hypothetical protein ACRCUY_10855 [Thermoguttaceae bacterium]